MAEFAYKATDSTGSPSTGRLTAHSRGEAYRLLRERGLQPVSVSSTDGSDTSKKSTTAANEPLPRLNTTQLLYFTEASDPSTLETLTGWSPRSRRRR